MPELPESFVARLNDEEMRAAAYALDAGFDIQRVESDIDLFVEIVRTARRSVVGTIAAYSRGVVLINGRAMPIEEIEERLRNA